MVRLLPTHGEANVGKQFGNPKILRTQGMLQVNVIFVADLREIGACEALELVLILSAADGFQYVCRLQEHH